MGTVADFDVPELIRYGKEKGVGIILWASWLTLRDQFDEAMDRFQQLGAVGMALVRLLKHLKYALTHW